MIQRYTNPEMGRIWTEQRRYETWLDVELAAAEAMAAAGIVPAEAAAELRAKARFDVARIEAIEKVTHHDVIAFTTSVAENVGPAARWLHFGLTSSDVVDTAQALQMVEACDVLLRLIETLRAAVRERAMEHRRTPMIGRTHGVHAEPMTFGLKLALWYDQLGRDITRVTRARDGVRVGKISGAVGTFAHLDPSIEADVCRRLGLRAGRHLHAGDPARSARRAAVRAGPDRRLARSFRPRDPRAAEDRDRRSRGAIRQGPEGLVGDAAQAQSDRLRADRRLEPVASRQCRGGLRERGPVARARHLPLVGGARDPARQLHRARSHAAAFHAHRERDGGVSGPDARESRAFARRGLLRAGAARAGPPGQLAGAGLRMGAAQCHARLPRANRLQVVAAGRRRCRRRAGRGRDRARVRARRAVAERGCDLRAGLRHRTPRRKTERRCEHACM